MPAPNGKWAWFQGFDFVAPHYRWIEALSAGNKLQYCRTFHLPKVKKAGHILILGEGNGRFLAECRRQLPEAQITCVDASAGMLELARRRLVRHGLPTTQIQFVRADAMEWSPPEKTFDLVVTHFFLDCFRREQLAPLVAKLAGAARPEAQWLLADFAMPQNGFARFRARIIHRMLYDFFRVTAGLRARRLTQPDEFLRESGFALAARKEMDWGLLHSDLWERGVHAASA